MDALFGSKVRTDTLVAVAALGTTYVSELARVLDCRLTEIQRAVAGLEHAGAIVTRMMGRTRLVELNPRFWGAAELYALLLRMSEQPSYGERFLLRRRPRAMRKAL